MNKEKQLKKLMESWEKLKKDANVFIKDNKLEGHKKKLEKFIKETNKDINKLIDKDFTAAKKTFLSEKKQIEKLLEKTVKDEINKAKKFLKTQKSEINKIQKNVEDIVKKSAKKVSKKTTKKHEARHADSTWCCICHLYTCRDWIFIGIAIVVGAVMIS